MGNVSRSELKVGEKYFIFGGPSKDDKVHHIKLYLGQLDSIQALGQNQNHYKYQFKLLKKYIHYFVTPGSVDELDEPNYKAHPVYILKPIYKLNHSVMKFKLLRALLSLM